MNKPIPRILTAVLAACALAVTLWSASPVQMALAQATPMPSPAATAMPSPAATPVASPMPNPAVTPAGNPPATAPSPGTDMLNNNPNGSAWLQKFNRQPTPEPAAVKGTTTMQAGHPAVSTKSAKCRALMKAYAGMTLTPAQHARLKAACMM